MTRKNSNILDLCFISLMTAIIAIMAQIAIPLPVGVPITMQTFAIALAGITLGARKGALATLIYIILGAIGLPIFSNFTGGYQCLIGPTGGFLLSFPIMAYIIGLGTKHNLTLPNIILGSVINLFCGALWFSLLGNIPFLTGVTTCVIPFIPATIIKIILSWIIGMNIRKRLLKMK